MAKKRKKINPRILILLAVVGALVVLGGVYFIVKRMPKDPAPLFAKADAHYEAGEFRQAIRYYSKGLIQQQRKKIEDADRVFDLAMAELQYATRTPELSTPQAQKYFMRGYKRLRQTLTIDPNHLDAHRQISGILWRQLARGNPDDYVTEADAVLALLDDEEDREEKAAFYVRRGQAKALLIHLKPEYLDEALADFDEAIRLEPTSQDYWLTGKLRLLLQQRQYEEAEKTVLAAIEANPNNAQMYVDYARVLIDSDRRSESLEQIEKAIKVQADNPVGYLAKANFLIKDQEWEQALAALDQAAAVDPDDLRVYRLRAFVMKRQFKLTEATAEIRAGLAVIEKLQASEAETQPDLEKYQLLQQTKVDLYFDLADSLLDEIRVGDEEMTAEQEQAHLDEVRKAMETLDTLIVFREGEAPPRYLKIQGRLAMIDGDRAEAQRKLEAAYEGFEKRNMFEPQTGNLLVRVYLQRRLPAKAEDVLNRFIERGYGAQPSVLLSKARIAMHYREYHQAQKLVERVLQRDPDNASAKELKMLLNIRTERGAIPAEGEIPITAVAYLLQQSERKWLEGKRQEAFELVQSLYKRMPENNAVLHRLMTMYLRLDQKAQAQAILEQAIERDPENQNLKDELTILKLPNDAERTKARLVMAEKIEDPYTRAMATAGTYMMVEDMANYMVHLQEALALADSDSRPRVLERLFRTAIQEEQWDTVDQCVTIATDENLDGADGDVFRAQVYLARGEADEAVQLLTGVVEDRPQHRAARMLLGEAHRVNGDLSLAAEQFEWIYNNDRGYSLAAIQMIQVSRAQADWPAWQRWVERAHTLVPNNPYVADQYLEMIEEGSNPEKIIERREAILRNYPDDINNRIRLGALYERTNQIAKAEAMYQSIIAKTPDKIGAAAVLIRFYDRIGRTDGIDTIISKLLEQAKTPEEKVAVYLLHARFLRDRSPEQALFVLDKAIEADPNDPRIYEAQAQIFTIQDQIEKAVEAAEKIVALRPDDPGQQKRLIVYRLEAGQLDQAEAELKQLLEADPDDVMALTLQGSALAQRDDIEGAKEYYSKALKINSDSALTLVRRAGLYILEDDLRAAREDLREAAAISKSPDVALELAKVYRQLNDVTSAQTSLQSIIRDNPGYQPAYRELADLWLSTQSWNRLAPLLESAREQFPREPAYALRQAQMSKLQGNEGAASASTARALQLDPGNEALIRQYLVQLFASKDYEKIATETAKYVDREGMGMWVLALQARALAEQGRMDEAEPVFERAAREAEGGNVGFVLQQYRNVTDLPSACKRGKEWLAFRKDDWALHAAIGTLLRENGDLAGSKEYMEKAMSLTDDEDRRAELQIGLGLTYAEMGEFDKAEQAYLSALKTAPDNIFALNNLAYLYVESLETPEKALDLARQAMVASPNNGSVLDTYGWTLARLGEYRDAVRHLRRAVQLLPSAPTRYHLGWVLEQQGNIAEARRQYEAARAYLVDQRDTPLWQDVMTALERVRTDR